ncbi:MAG: transporter substrate-binding domain-containing protein [Oscillospiraceae bacterium]|nr:transporter substrate-binding domain-containing protein [Oscillospiraceae bacterium]
MSKFKKLTAMALSAVMALSLLAGCGDSAASSAAPAESAAATEAPAAETAAAEAAGSTAEAGAATEAAADPASYGADVQAIIDRGVLKVGVKSDVLGFGYMDPLTSEYEGMEIDLAKKLADYLGVDVEFTTVTAATRTELLDSGDIDCVMATFTITDERKQSWDFTTPYFTDHVTVLVKDSSNIKTLEDLKDKTVGVSSGSTSAKSLVKAMIENGVITGDGFNEESFDPATWTDGVKFKQYDDYPSISTALEADEVDAFCVDKSILAVYKTAGRSYVDAEFSPQEYGIATTKGSGFSKLCEDQVSAWLSDGTIGSLTAQYNLG